MDPILLTVNVTIQENSAQEHFPSFIGSFRQRSLISLNPLSNGDEGHNQRHPEHNLWAADYPAKNWHENDGEERHGGRMQ